MSPGPSTGPLTIADLGAIEVAIGRTYPWATGIVLITDAVFLIGGATLDRAPRAGERIHLERDGSLLAGKEGEIWLLFERQHDLEGDCFTGAAVASALADLRFVRCRFLTDPGPAPSCFWLMSVEVEILEVFGPDELLALPSFGGSIDSALKWIDSGTRTVQHGKLHYSYSEWSRDLFSWLLLVVVDECAHLLAQGQHLIGSSPEVAFGNRPLTTAEAARLISGRKPSHE